MKTPAVYIVSAVRTPMGSFGGVLKELSATQLGSLAIAKPSNAFHLPLTEINDVLMGSVLQANLGQAPARQAF